MIGATEGNPNMLSEKTKAKLIGLDPNSWDPVYIDPFAPSQGKNLVPKKPVLPSNPYPIALNESIGPANGWLLYDIVTLDGTAYMLDGKLLDPTMMVKTELEQAEEAEKYIEQKYKYLEHPPLGRSPEAPDSRGTRWDWLMF